MSVGLVNRAPKRVLQPGPKAGAAVEVPGVVRAPEKGAALVR
jgi:hypothetical protein